MSTQQKIELIRELRGLLSLNNTEHVALTEETINLIRKLLQETLKGLND